jgi:succinate dehydrogenase/fumarate reductase flavoprotein subunit
MSKVASEAAADDAVSVDLLVLGGGMAGMTAGAVAAGLGLSVGLVERAPDIGGSAVLSGGGMIKLDSPQALTDANPRGDPALANMLFEAFDPVLAWIESLGVAVTPPARVEEMIGIPATLRGIDIVRYIALARLEIESAGGWVVTNARVDTLDEQDGAVIGARVIDRDGATTVRARAVLLATGGFQGSPALRERYLGSAAKDMLLRANPFSDGAGLSLAKAMGGATSDVMDRFYGHTVPAPLAKPFVAGDFVRLSMPFMATRSLLLDRAGRRFVDESHGYYTDAWSVLRQPDARALLIGDQVLRDADVAGNVANRTLGFELIDRPTEAARAGARVCEAETFEALDAAAAAWGYSGVAEAVADFNRRIAADEPMDPPRRNHRRVLQAPFFAIEVQPAITFTFGGLRVNDALQVLRQDGTIIPNLVATGADVGGAFCEQYASGLTLAATSAYRAVTALRDRLAQETAAA